MARRRLARRVAERIWSRVAIERVYASLMPGLPKVPRDVRTVHLGEFLTRHADLITEQLDAHGIVWWSKEPGPLSKIWQLGVELFVDRDRLQQARELANTVLSESSTA